MKAFNPYSRSAGHHVRQSPARSRGVAGEARAPAGPSAREVLGEIGIILAVHLAVALAIGVALKACGIA
jgi:hypothetical protein